MLGLEGLLPLIIPFVIAFIAFATLIIVSAIKEKKKEKDGQVIDLADFEYDSKEQVFRKKEKENLALEHLDDMFSDETTDPTRSYLSQNLFHSDD